VLGKGESPARGEAKGDSWYSEAMEGVNYRLGRDLGEKEAGGGRNSWCKVHHTCVPGQRGGGPAGPYAATGEFQEGPRKRCTEGWTKREKKGGGEKRRRKDEGVPRKNADLCWTTAETALGKLLRKEVSMSFNKQGPMLMPARL